ncbi:MAG: KpsF/GutQ family sugar-phosphate isomerase [Rikenellaceae bacterium]|nr:KpsF/GutQ family sugar-phosphate isomerase [Rikenellaceae bacterium]
MGTILQSAVETIRTEAGAIAGLETLLDDDFEGAVRAILGCGGKVVVTGMGKSGIIGKKIAATLASTGTPSFFLHPGEAYHGDLGMVEPRDIVLAIANSGTTDEVLRLIPFLKNRGNVLIGMTGKPGSLLASHSDYHLNIAVPAEACPMNLAPTSSTTAMLVMGDALAVALMRERGFTPEDYAVYHPGGSLGRRLLTRVGDVMRTDVPRISGDMPLASVIIAISEARMGIAAVVEGDRLLGVITDGDIRRAMARYESAFFDKKASEIMSAGARTIGPGELVSVAEEIMHRNRIHSLIVVDSGGRVEGVVEFFHV